MIRRKDGPRLKATAKEKTLEQAFKYRQSDSDLVLAGERDIPFYHAAKLLPKEAIVEMLPWMGCIDVKDRSNVVENGINYGLVLSKRVEDLDSDVLAELIQGLKWGYNWEFLRPNDIDNLELLQKLNLSAWLGFTSSDLVYSERFNTVFSYKLQEYQACSGNAVERKKLRDGLSGDVLSKWHRDSSGRMDFMEFGAPQRLKSCGYPELEKRYPELKRQGYWGFNEEFLDRVSSIQDKGYCVDFLMNPDLSKDYLEVLEEVTIELRRTMNHADVETALNGIAHSCYNELGGAEAVELAKSGFNERFSKRWSDRSDRDEDVSNEARFRVVDVPESQALYTKALTRNEYYSEVIRTGGIANGNAVYCESDAVAAEWICKLLNSLGSEELAQLLDDIHLRAEDPEQAIKVIAEIQAVICSEKQRLKKENSSAYSSNIEQLTTLRSLLPTRWGYNLEVMRNILKLCNLAGMTYVMSVVETCRIRDETESAAGSMGSVSGSMGSGSMGSAGSNGSESASSQDDSDNDLDNDLEGMQEGEMFAASILDFLVCYYERYEIGPKEDVTGYSAQDLGMLVDLLREGVDIRDLLRVPKEDLAGLSGILFQNKDLVKLLSKTYDIKLLKLAMVFNEASTAGIFTTSIAEPFKDSASQIIELIQGNRINAIDVQELPTEKFFWTVTLHCVKLMLSSKQQFSKPELKRKLNEIRFNDAVTKELTVEKMTHRLCTIHGVTQEEWDAEREKFFSLLEIYGKMYSDNDVVLSDKHNLKIGRVCDAVDAMTLQLLKAVEEVESNALPNGYKQRMKESLQYLALAATGRQQIFCPVTLRRLYTSDLKAQRAMLHMIFKVGMAESYAYTEEWFVSFMKDLDKGLQSTKLGFKETRMEGFIESGLELEVRW